MDRLAYFYTDSDATTAKIKKVSTLLSLCCQQCLYLPILIYFAHNHPQDDTETIFMIFVLKQELGVTITTVRMFIRFLDTAVDTSSTHPLRVAILFIVYLPSL